MASLSSSSPALLCSPFATAARRRRTGSHVSIGRFPLRGVSASRNGTGGSSSGWEPPGGSLVDEGMVELRRRIREIEEEEAPEHWMEWEKKYYRSYPSDVCAAVGLLQHVLMRTRPGVALGVAALLGLSVPTSAAIVAFHLVDAVKNVFH